MSNYVVGDLNDIISMVSILGLLLFFLTPTFLAIMIVYFIRRINRRNKERQKVLKAQKEITEKAQNEDSIIIVTEVEHYPLPQDYDKFRNLALEFDEKGQVRE